MNNNSTQYDKENNNQSIQHDLELNNDHVLFTYVNQWEKHSIAKIQLAAQQIRNDFKELFNKKNQSFINSIIQINEQIQKNKNTDINLKKWTQQLDKLRQQLSDISSSIYLQHDKDKLPIYLIKLTHENTNHIKQIDKNTDEDDINVPGTVLLTSMMLNKATLEEQKQMLGERLFVLVQQIEPNLTAKITGMFLELDMKYILILIKSHEILKAKVKEAIGVLQAHQYRQHYVIKS